MSSFTSASLISSACASVLTAMNSTPFSPASIMRLTALHAAAADADDLDHGEVVLRGAGHGRNLRDALDGRGSKPPLEVESYVNLWLCLTLYRSMTLRVKHRHQTDTSLMWARTGPWGARTSGTPIGLFGSSFSSTAIAARYLAGRLVRRTEADRALRASSRATEPSASHVTTHPLPQRSGEHSRASIATSRGVSTTAPIATGAVGPVMRRTPEGSAGVSAIAGGPRRR